MLRSVKVLERGYLVIGMLLMSFLANAQEQAESQTDQFLSGYITAILEHELQWGRGSYTLTVVDGIATIRLPEENAQRRAQIESALSGFDGLQGMNIVVQQAFDDPEATTSTRKKLYSFLGITPDTIPFPNSELFWPLLADPKQPQFFMSYRNYDTPLDRTTIAAVGFGESFGFYRRAGKRAGDGAQLSLSGGLFAQFNLDAPSSDLINADYIIGLPLTYRRAPWSGRLRIYHQSSHLGDEFLLNAQPERINLSFESMELLISYSQERWRGYIGGEYIFHREPADLRPGGLHAGVEYRSKQPLLYGGRLIGGLDLKSWEQHDWSVDASLKLGLEFGTTQPGHRRMRLIVEAYDGHAPHGQFYETEITYYGLGVYFGF